MKQRRYSIPIPRKVRVQKNYEFNLEISRDNRGDFQLKVATFGKILPYPLEPVELTIPIREDKGVYKINFAECTDVNGIKYYDEVISFRPNMKKVFSKLEEEITPEINKILNSYQGTFRKKFRKVIQNDGGQNCRKANLGIRICRVRKYSKQKSMSGAAN